jgi:type II secretory pathway component PulF
MEATVPLPRCLELAAGACRNIRLAGALRRAGHRVREGTPLGQALELERTPRPLQVAARNAAAGDLPRALWTAADAALAEARIGSGRLSTGLFCLALLVAAFCIGLTLTQLWVALSRMPEMVS